jgi:hypothetical protein
MTHRTSALTLAVVLSSVLAHAGPIESVSTTDGVRVGVETSPVLAALDGYQVTVAVRLPAAPRWRFGVSAFGIQVPETFAELDNQGWSVHDNGFAAGVERELGHAARGGWLLGAAFVGQQRRTSRSDGTGTLLEYDLMLQAGYRWYPSRRVGLEVTPWIGLPIALHRTAEPVIDGMTYKFRPVGFVPNVAVGWEF